MLTRMGTVAFRMGDYSQSAVLYQQSLALNRKQGNEQVSRTWQVWQPWPASSGSQGREGARLFGAVEALREVRGISLPPLRRTVEDIRTQLHDAAFVEAWAKGRAVPLEQAIVYAFQTKNALPTDAKSPEVGAGGDFVFWGSFVPTAFAISRAQAALRSADLPSSARWRA